VAASRESCHVLLANVVQGADVRVIKGGHGPRLALEADAAFWVGT
jgi:hypothetical protein